MKTRPASIRLLLVTAMCLFTVTGCWSTGGDCLGICPPDAADDESPIGSGTGPSGSWVQAQATTYGTGGMMISVNIGGSADHGKGDPWGDEADIRVWADTGPPPATATIPSSSHRIRSPTSFDIKPESWAGSTIVRTPPGTTKFHVFIEVTLHESGGPGTLPLYFRYPWDPDALVPGWQDAPEY